MVATFTFWGTVIYDHADITGTKSVDNAYNVTPTTAATQKATKKPSPRLDLYPMPATSETGALLLSYTRGWNKLEEDTDTVFVPDWLESLYLRAARIFARGYEEEDIFDRDAALAGLMNGPEFQAAATRDGNIQTNLGSIEGGVGRRRGYYRSFEGSVADPT